MTEDVTVQGNAAHPFYFVGNLPCLDFVNTEIIARGERVDLLAGFGDIVRWLQAATLITTAEARAIQKRWGNSSEGKAAFTEALSLRAALRATAERIAARKPADRSPIEPINRVLASRPTYRQLELT